MIRLENLTRVFREGTVDTRVFEHINLEIAAGEIVVLLGRSGSGKSTLLNLISGIDRPTSGTVEVDSLDISRLSERDRTLFRRARLGFVFQFFNLISTLTVIENLRLPLELNHRAREQVDDRALEMLRAVGLEKKEHSYPDRLSGGEQQRVAIARALVHDPQIILADEPTGNLDKETGLEVLALLDDQVRRSGKTMVMATHSREVIGMADRIIRFADGRLIELAPGDVR